MQRHALDHGSLARVQSCAPARRGRRLFVPRAPLSRRLLDCPPPARRSLSTFDRSGVEGGPSYVPRATRDDEPAQSDVRSPSRVAYLTSRRVISTFETIIRYLGGMLAAYVCQTSALHRADRLQDLSSDPLMLARATELGDWLLPALGTTSGLAIGRHTMGLNRPGAQSGMSTLSEVGSLTLEFTRLSMLTGDETYFLAVGLPSLPDASLTRVGTTSDRRARQLPLIFGPARHSPPHPRRSVSPQHALGGVHVWRARRLVLRVPRQAGAAHWERAATVRAHVHCRDRLGVGLEAPARGRGGS